MSIGILRCANGYFAEEVLEERFGVEGTHACKEERVSSFTLSCIPQIFMRMLLNFMLHNIITRIISLIIFVLFPFSSPFAAKRPYKKRKTAQTENRDGEVGAASSAGLKDENADKSLASHSAVDSASAAAEGADVDARMGSLHSDPARGADTDSEEDAA